MQKCTYWHPQHTSSGWAGSRVVRGRGFINRPQTNRGGHVRLTSGAGGLGGRQRRRMPDEVRQLRADDDSARVQRHVAEE